MRKWKRRTATGSLKSVPRSVSSSANASTWGGTGGTTGRGRRYQANAAAAASASAARPAPIHSQGGPRRTRTSGLSARMSAASPSAGSTDSTSTKIAEVSIVCHWPSSAASAGR